MSEAVSTRAFSERLEWALLVLGACVGLGLAIPSLATTARGVSVNGVQIPAARIEAMVAAGMERERVIERLIEEELLVQHGLELGMARSHSRVRGVMVQLVRDSLVSDAEPPAEDTLRRFYEAERPRFTAEPLLEVSALGGGLAPPAEQVQLHRAAEEPLDAVQA